MLAAAFETLRGRRVRVARIGTGPPIVLLHGYPDNLQIWSRLATLLAARHEVIAFDWPGMGSSEAWPGGATPEHMAGRLLEILDAWGIERAGIAAMDMGGQPALAFAALHPERVRELVVMNSLLFGDARTSWEIAVLRRFGWNRLLLRSFPRIVFRRALGTFLPRGEKLSGDLEADLWECFRRPEVRRFIVKMCAGYQGTLDRLPDLYRRVACRTLVLWAEDDGHFPPVHAERLHAMIPGSSLEVLPRARHWMVWSRAGEVASHIARIAAS